MQVKKTKKANLENRRVFFFQIGLIIGMFLLIGVFELGTQKKDNAGQDEIIGIDLDIEMISIERKEKPRPPKPQNIRSLELNITSNEQTINYDNELDYSLFEKLPDFYDYELYVEEPELELITELPIQIAEKMPEFYGGQKALLKYLSENVEYPVEAREQQIQGTVYVRFVVEKNGKIGKVELVRAIDKLIDREAIKVVKNMPAWKAGQQRGVNVSVWFTIPIVFQLINY